MVAFYAFTVKTGVKIIRFIRSFVVVRCFERITVHRTSTGTLRKAIKCVLQNPKRISVSLIPADFPVTNSNRRSNAGISVSSAVFAGLADMTNTLSRGSDCAMRMNSCTHLVLRAVLAMRANKIMFLRFNMSFSDELLA